LSTNKVKLAVLVDFGSTFTKVIAVDLAGRRLLGTAQAPSTVDSDVTIGLHQAFGRLSGQGIDTPSAALMLGCSSAAGGLRMVAVGLVPSLTVEAARRAALGAGAKVIKAFGYKLSRAEITELKNLAPDVILLAGGTDGGDADTILSNARSMAAAGLQAPVVVAGNKSVGPEAVDLLLAGGIDARLTENVLSELDHLNVEPARDVIRQVFIEHIVHAKGLDRARELVEDIIMPTPMAVLRATQLLADGPPGATGLGETMVVDVGGATTDVHTVAAGTPTTPGVALKGLPEPRVKRTVEGDLGVRINAQTILEVGGTYGLFKEVPLAPEDLAQAVERRVRQTATTPDSEQEFGIDRALAAAAVAVATDRHCGVLEEVWTAQGKTFVQYGKDLRQLKLVVGTGGVFAYGRGPRAVLEAVTHGDPMRLKPVHPQYWIDRRYILYGMGLLAERFPDIAYTVLRENLEEI